MQNVLKKNNFNKIYRRQIHTSEFGFTLLDNFFDPSDDSLPSDSLSSDAEDPLWIEFSDFVSIEPSISCFSLSVWKEMYTF